jgi:Domain of unknown function (DUF4158)
MATISPSRIVEADLIRYYVFSAPDLAVIRRHRDHNRLDFAVQLSYLRFPGRLLAPDETPYPPTLAMSAAQLKVPTGCQCFQTNGIERPVSK